MDQDIIYWKNKLLEDVTKNYSCNGKYIIFEPWHGGFNNIRMSFELACVIAYRLNRILVLPNPYKITHLNGVNGFESFFDINDIGIQYLNINEFCKLHNIDNTWDAIKNISTIYTFLPDASYINLTDDNIDKKYSKHRQIITIDNEPSNIFFNHNLLGTFYTLLYDNNMLELVKYVKKHVHYKENIFTQANKIVKFLYDSYANYYSLHIRRTDFKCAYKSVCIDMDTLYKNIRQLIPAGACIYISTDIKNKDELEVLNKSYTVVILQDVLHLIDADTHVDLYGMIEQIVCSRGVKFIGTHLSTFSCYIYRLRGYMSDIIDKTHYINTTMNTTLNNSNKLALGWEYEWSSNDNVWSREFIDGYEVNMKHYKFQSFYFKYVAYINVKPVKNKKIISFSLYDINSTLSKTRGFYKGIYVNYHLAKSIYPDWTIRVYMPHNEPRHIINELSQFTDIELILVDTNICLRALRFLPYDDDNVEVWLSRDLDSIVNDREKEAVNDWLINYPNKELHIMTDNFQHTWTVACGMFGFKNNINANTSLIAFILQFSYDNYNIHQSYDFDSKIVDWFLYKTDNYIQHYGSGKKLENTKPFPEHIPIDCSFVGNIMDIQKYYNNLNLESIYPVLCKNIQVSFKNNSLFYYSPWNTKCILNWYNDTDFTLMPIKTESSTSDINSCFKTENGDGIKLLNIGNHINVLWDGNSYREVFLENENTIVIMHKNEQYYFNRIIQKFYRA